MLSITVVYDNHKCASGLTPRWGFSCFLVVKAHGDARRLLFDTGGDGATLLENMQKLGVDVKSVDAVVISHAHGDHTGGLHAVLEKNPFATVYSPSKFRLRAVEKEVKFIIVEERTELFNAVYSTGALGGFIKEQALVIQTEKGNVVITGCAHPGIVKILKVVKKGFGDVYLVLGGFHMPKSGVSEEFKQLGVVKVAPCHCTGIAASKELETAFGSNFLKCGVGARIQM
ncbi:MBL fold metallo-hydrolase [Candidatus Alkanophaga liquidiphilum]|nr:Divalent metal cationefflux pump [Candidatus Alkanophaga liquidiphilum]RLG38515.1 MAG: hypothetical protein DRN91_02405 [Candidatus Alkanophagales archaeon]